MGGRNQRRNKQTNKQTNKQQPKPVVKLRSPLRKQNTDDTSTSDLALVAKNTNRIATIITVTVVESLSREKSVL
eukprot:jgi/Psemu1/310127/fgenesh1_kg.595_\